jgi:hypothetical protein
MALSQLMQVSQELVQACPSHIEVAAGAMTPNSPAGDPVCMSLMFRVTAHATPSRAGRP